MFEHLRVGWLSCCITLASLQAFGAENWQATGQRGVIVAGGNDAVEGGMAVFSAGGNAMDAAVATILAQSVTDSSAFCFGGEVPILVYDAKRQVVEVIGGQGAAPRLATLRVFRESWRDILDRASNRPPCRPHWTHA